MVNNEINGNKQVFSDYKKHRINDQNTDKKIP